MPPKTTQKKIGDLAASVMLLAQKSALSWGSGCISCFFRYFQKGT
jgi:hypothetical protein